MIVEKTAIQIHTETRELLNVFKERAFEDGKIDRPSANDAIKYLLKKEGLK
jgi:hypothetical protein